MSTQRFTVDEQKGKSGCCHTAPRSDFGQCGCAATSLSRSTSSVPLLLLSGRRAVSIPRMAVPPGPRPPLVAVPTSRTTKSQPEGLPADDSALAALGQELGAWSLFDGASRLALQIDGRRIFCTGQCRATLLRPQGTSEWQLFAIHMNARAFDGGHDVTIECQWNSLLQRPVPVSSTADLPVRYSVATRIGGKSVRMRQVGAGRWRIDLRRFAAGIGTDAIATLSSEIEFGEAERVLGSAESEYDGSQFNRMPIVYLPTRRPNATKTIQRLGTRIASVLINGRFDHVQLGFRARRLVVEPLFFIDLEREPDYLWLPAFDIARFAARGLSFARQVWAKAGVIIDSLPARLVDLSELRAIDVPMLGNALDAVRRLGGLDLRHEQEGALPTVAREGLEQLGQRDGVIRIFYFRTAQFGDEGIGSTINSGEPNAFVLTSIANNDFEGHHRYHVGHELGHVLGLRHPFVVAEGDNEPGSGHTIMCPGDNNQSRSKNSVWHARQLRNVHDAIIHDALPPADCCDDERDRAVGCRAADKPCQPGPGGNTPDCR